MQEEELKIGVTYSIFRPEVDQNKYNLVYRGPHKIITKYTGETVYRFISHDNNIGMELHWSDLIYVKHGIKTKLNILLDGR